jgi:nucleotide-binding universal stress UspA family protein
VVGVDATRSSLRAVAYAAGQAARQQARLIAVYVTPPRRGASALTLGPSLEVALAEAQRDLLRDIEQALLDHAGTCGVDAELVVTSGGIVHELTAVARRQAADAIVIGASTGLLHHIVGGVGTHLSRHAPCPVTVVP